MSDSDTQLPTAKTYIISDLAELQTSSLFKIQFDYKSIDNVFKTIGGDVQTL